MFKLLHKNLRSNQVKAIPNNTSVRGRRDSARGYVVNRDIGNKSTSSDRHHVVASESSLSDILEANTDMIAWVKQRTEWSYLRGTQKETRGVCLQQSTQSKDVKELVPLITGVKNAFCTVIQQSAGVSTPHGDEGVGNETLYNLLLVALVVEGNDSHSPWMGEKFDHHD